MHPAAPFSTSRPIVIVDHGRERIDQRRSFGEELRTVPQNGEVGEGIQDAAPAVERPDSRQR